MAFPTTHILLSMILASLLRRKFKFPRGYIFLAGFAGLLPDIDWAYEVLRYFISGTKIALESFWTHLIWWPILALLLALAFKLFKKEYYATITALVSMSLFLHLLLDWAFMGTIQFFYPISTIAYGLDWLPHTSLGYSVFAAMDGAILLLWLFHEEFHKKIKSYW